MKKLLLTFLFTPFALAPAAAQQLRVEISPPRPAVHQEFEVAYTADREIESITPPRWGALTLVRELGQSQGSETSILNGETTRSQHFSCRYLVRSPIAGEITVPGTTAVVDGRECRFEGRTITILAGPHDVAPACRMELDTVASAHAGECVVRLLCNRRPDRAGPLLTIDGRDSCAPFSSGYSRRDSEETYEFAYRIPMREGRKYRLTPQLTFGGAPFDAPVYVVTQGDEPAPKSNVRWLLCLVAGAIACLWCAIWARDHAVPRSRQQVVSRFSWRAYLLAALALLLTAYIAFFVCWLFSPAGKVHPTLVFVVFLLLFALFWLVSGDIRRSAVRLRVEGETLYVIPFLGLGRTRRYDLRQFEGVTTSLLPGRYGSSYEYGYLLIAGRREVRIASFYLKNYREVFDAVTACCSCLGRRPLNLWLELKELFR